MGLLPLLLVLAITAADGSALVEHSLDAGQKFSSAGLITLTDSADAVSAVFERDAISFPQLQQLVESDGLYLWRVTLPEQPPVLTSIKASCLASALPSPQYALHLDASGQIISAQISVPTSATPGGSCSTSHALQTLKGLSSRAVSEQQDVQVAVHTPQMGPPVPKPPETAAAPDLTAAAGGAPQQAAQQQQQKQRQQKQQQAASKQAADGSTAADGEADNAPPPVDERTWLQKNWLIVMAGSTMVLNIVMKNVMGDPQGQGGGQQGRPPQRRPVQ